MADKWWERDDVREAFCVRSDNRAVKVAMLPGGNGAEPLLQVANCWNPSEGIEGADTKWLPLKRQPVLRFEEIVEQPAVLELLREFVAACDAAMAEK